MKEQWDTLGCVTAIRSHRASAMPTMQQRLREMGYMLRHSGLADIIHLVASLQGPSPWAGPALRPWSAIRRRPIVHTLPSVGTCRSIVATSPATRRWWSQNIRVVAWRITVSPTYTGSTPPLNIESLHPAAPQTTNGGLGDRASP